MRLSKVTRYGNELLCLLAESSFIIFCNQKEKVFCPGGSQPLADAPVEHEKAEIFFSLFGKLLLKVTMNFSFCHLFVTYQESCVSVRRQR